MTNIEEVKRLLADFPCAKYKELAEALKGCESLRHADGIVTGNDVVHMFSKGKLLLKINTKDAGCLSNLLLGLQTWEER